MYIPLYIFTGGNVENDKRHSSVRSSNAQNFSCPKSYDPRNRPSHPSCDIDFCLLCFFVESLPAYHIPHLASADDVGGSAFQYGEH